MEKIAYYSAILERLLADEAERASTQTDLEVCVVCDTARHHYQLLYLGWQGINRVFSPLIHARIHNGKIWIEQDGTEDGVATRLLELGLTKEEIVLAFYSPQKRPFTEFAAA